MPFFLDYSLRNTGTRRILVVTRFTGYRLPVNFPTGNLGRPETADRVVEPFWDEGRGLGQAI